MRHKIVVSGRPVPKGRPRFSKGHAYTPVKTRMYEELVGWKTREVIKEPLQGDVAVYITVHGNGFRGDLDNIAKTILDGMNGIAYKDDRQICSLSIQRIFDKEERVEIEIEEVST